jgi:TatD DNase family protein
MYPDSHCHLTHDAFDEERDLVLQRAREAKVGPLLTVGTNIIDSRLARDLAHDHEDVYATAGVHPHDAESYSPVVLGQLLRLSHEPEVVAIGEIGLDYHREHSPRDRQLTVFRELVQAAVQVNRPVVVHSRDAEEDTMAVLAEEGGGKARGVLHCFSGSLEMARRALEMGFYISFAGNVTYPAAKALREVVAEVPPGRILLETDSPFLAPQPMRGRRNEPAYIVPLYEAVAKIRGVKTETLSRRVRENFQELFQT